jgi:hypothetical protein
MKQLACVVVLVVLGAACGGNQQAPASESAPAPASPQAPTGEPLDIRLSNPVEPRTGENAFEVTVTQGTQPVTDAEVSLELFMAAMPAMNMPEMKNTIALKHEGGGRYRGTGSVAMAGAWDASMMVMRGGQHLGDETVTIVAK